MDHSDALWLHDSSLNRQILQCVLVLEPGLDLPAIRDAIHQKVVLPAQERRRGAKTNKFIRKIVPLYSGHAWIRDSDFDINNHVIKMADSVKTNEDLQNYVGCLSSQPFPKDRPLWEVQVLTDFGAQKETLVLLRLHPSLSDGWALMNMLINLLADSPVHFNTRPHFGRGTYFMNLVRTCIVGPIVFLQKWILTRKDYNVLHGALQLSGQKVW